MAQKDGPAALKAYLALLATNEGLVQRDPANTEWQVDVAISCFIFGSLDSLLIIQQRREYLGKGLNLLTALKQAGRLLIRIGHAGLTTR